MTADPTSDDRSKSAAPTDTEHPTGDDQAAENDENELAG